MIKGCYPSINTMFCLLTTRRFLLFLPHCPQSAFILSLLSSYLFFHLRHLILDKLLIESQCLRFLVFLGLLDSGFTFLSFVDNLIHLSIKVIFFGNIHLLDDGDNFLEHLLVGKGGHLYDKYFTYFSSFF